MENIEGQHMTDRERTLIAMGAAMGAGCRKCAEGLQRIGASIGIPTGEAWKAFEIGLNAKAEAVNTMRAAVSALLHNEADSGAKCGCARSGETEPGRRKPDNARAGSAGKMACLIRLASYMAANSAPDARAEMDEAVARGANSRDINLCLSIARMVRQKAAGFSDGEVGGPQGERKVNGCESGAGYCEDAACDTGRSCSCI